MFSNNETDHDPLTVGSMHVTCKLFGHKPAEPEVRLRIGTCVFLYSGEALTVIHAIEQTQCVRCWQVIRSVTTPIAVGESEERALEAMMLAKVEGK